jgi:hypothetical protein
VIKTIVFAGFGIVGDDLALHGLKEILTKERAWATMRA